jgi:LacI family transcriptional regulator
MKRVSMADVANLAGVSKSTVSHVINETRHVEEETRQRVLEAIRQLDYRPSSIARSLVLKRTHTAGLLVSDVGNPFYHEVILGVEDVALAHDYSVFLFNASYDLERSTKYIHSMVDKRVDGVLFMSSRMSVELVGELQRHGIPAVILDWEEQDMEGTAALTVDFETGIFQAVEHLVALGHKRFAHVSGPLDLWTARVRRDTFLKALQLRDIDPTGVMVVEGNLRMAGGRRALREFLRTDPWPTAVFAANDLTALGIILEAREQGLSVPRDLSVIGLDNIGLAEQMVPALTTVDLPRYEIGNLAMNMLLELLDIPEELREQCDCMRKQVSSSLVVRESTGPTDGTASMGVSGSEQGVRLPQAMRF